MTRTWNLLVWTGKKYQPANCGKNSFEARGPKHALKIAGLNDPSYEIEYSRKGYGYYTGRIEVRIPETAAAGEHQPADFILEVTR